MARYYIQQGQYLPNVSGVYEPSSVNTWTNGVFTIATSGMGYAIIGPYGTYQGLPYSGPLFTNGNMASPLGAYTPLAIPTPPPTGSPVVTLYDYPPPPIPPPHDPDLPWFVQVYCWMTLWNTLQLAGTYLAYTSSGMISNDTIFRKVGSSGVSLSEGFLRYDSGYWHLGRGSVSYYTNAEMYRLDGYYHPKPMQFGQYYIGLRPPSGPGPFGPPHPPPAPPIPPPAPPDVPTDKLGSGLLLPLHHADPYGGMS